MKILHITTRIDGLGGLQRSVVERLNFLSRNDFEIHLLTTNSQNKTQWFGLDQKITHTDKQKVSGLRTYTKLILDIYKQFQPDWVVVSDNGLKGFLIPYILPQKAKVCYELHTTRQTLIRYNTKLFGLLGISQLLIRKASKRFNAFVVLSENEAQNWKGKNIYIIPNPIGFPKVGSNELNHKKIIFVGRLKLIKGIDLLIEIWSKISPEFPEWSLEIYGEPDPEYDLEQTLIDLNLHHTTTIHQPTKSLWTHYQECSLLLMTSRYEAFGQVLTEAMWCGLPVIAFDAPVGPRSIIHHNKNGFLIPCFDTKQFISNTKKLLKDKSLRKAMGTHSQNMAHKYQIEIIMQQWIKLFTSR